MQSVKTSYATNAAVRRAIHACEKSGLRVESIKLHPDGIIELISPQSSQGTRGDEFDCLEALGCL
jgi:hypothetical protein